MYFTDFGLFCPHYYLSQDLDQITLFNPTIDKECFFAPEIFLKEGETRVINFQEEKQEEKQILMKADMFSLGCILYSILTDGKILFNYSQLMKYKEGDQEQILKDLNNIKNEKDRLFVQKLIDLNPNKRESAKEAFLYYHNKIFKNDIFIIYYFNFLLRHRALNMNDHQIFLIAAFFSYCKKNSFYEFKKSEKMIFSKYTGFSFYRVPRIIEEIKKITFEQIIKEILPDKFFNHQQLLIKDFNSFTNKFITQLSIQNQIIKRTLEKILQNQKNQTEKLKKFENIDYEKIQKKIIEKIANNKNFIEEFTGKQFISVNFLSYACNMLNYTFGDEGKFLILELIQQNIQFIPQDNLIIQYIPMIINSFQYDNQMPKLFLFQTCTKIIKQFQFLHNEQFCKFLAIENYIFTLIDCILNQDHSTILQLQFIKQMKHYLQMIFVFLVSFTLKQKDFDGNFKNSTRFRIPFLQVQQFFFNKITKLLFNSNTQIQMLKEFQYILNYFDKNFIQINFYPKFLEYLKFENTRNYSLQIISNILSKEFEYTKVFKIILKDIQLYEQNHQLQFLIFTQEIFKSKRKFDHLLYIQLFQILIMIYKLEKHPIIFEQLRKTLNYVVNNLNFFQINFQYLDFIKEFIQYDIINFENVTSEELINYFQNIFSYEKQKQKIFFTSQQKTEEIDIEKNKLKNSENFEKNIILDYQKFLFSTYFFQIPKTELPNESFKKLEDFLDFFYNEWEKKKKISLSRIFSQNSEEQFTSYKNFQEITNKIKLQIKQKNAQTLFEFENQENFFALNAFFKNFFFIHKVNQLQITENQDLFFVSSSVRQMNFQGSIISTLKNKDQIITLEKCGQMKFQVSYSNGDLKTFDLNKKSKNLSNYEIQNFNLNQKGNYFNQILGLPYYEETILADKNNNLLQYNLDQNKIINKWKLDGKVSCLKEVNPLTSKFKTHFLSLQENGKVSLFDLRQKNSSLNSINLNPLLGSPNQLLPSKNNEQIYISTKKGFLIRYDIRQNIFTSLFQLQRKNKPLKIQFMTEFEASTKFLNMQNNLTHLILTYPSRNNEFSIFSLDELIQDQNQLPKMHFYSKQTLANQLEYGNVPFLYTFQNNPKNFQLETLPYNSLYYLKMLYQYKKNLGNNYQKTIKSIDNYLNFFKNQMKQNYESQLRYSDDTNIYLQETINQVISQPTLHSKLQDDQTIVDNIIITAGDDRNIRFLNFGNNFQNQDICQKNFGSLNCYHLANNDMLERKYNFCYIGDIFMLKEEIGIEIKKKKIEGIENTFGIINESGFKFQNNGLSAFQNLNFGSEHFIKKKTVGNSLAQATHDLSIDKIILMNQEEKFYLISKGDDNIIKLWNQNYFNLQQLNCSFLFNFL